jgi:hypothetical protein
MIFNRHFNLEGRHAFLGASKYHWINYDDEKLISAFQNFRAAQKGTELHDFAKRCIELGIKLPKSKKTLNMYVNDAIGFKMTPEVTLYYSDNCFGTTDAIAFKNGVLRIHDYKSGVTPADMKQLLIYNALFCLEYHIKPTEIEHTELRIYQMDEIISEEPDSDKIFSIMDKIVRFDELIDRYGEER